MGDDDEVPRFDPNGTRYDSSSYAGRLRNILSAINPATLLLSDAEVAASQARLRAFRENGNALPLGVTDADMWTAQQQVAAVIHPATGEPISPTIGRMSAFIFPNCITAAGMLMHGPTSVGAGVFWQWVNQSYNCANNYANRSSADVDMTALAQSYGLAVGAACSIALGAGAVVKRVPALRNAGLLVPYVATVVAGGSNVAFTRINEMTDGIAVYDGDGDELGVSVAAGRAAVFNTVLTRSAFLPVFPLLFPPMIVSAAKKAKWIRAGTPAAVVFEVCTIVLFMGIGLPAALALQPQKMNLNVADLEEQFQGVDPKTGLQRTIVFANKGL
jgi:tricarboxylate carrier